MKIKRETLARYLQILEDAKVVSKCARFDLKSRKSLRGEQKYYLADLSFYFALNTDNRINYGPVLENIVYRYALAQGCKVSVGRESRRERRKSSDFKGKPAYADELELANARAACHHRSGVHLLPFPYANGFPLNTGKALNSP